MTRVYFKVIATTETKTTKIKYVSPVLCLCYGDI